MVKVKYTQNLSAGAPYSAGAGYSANLGQISKDLWTKHTLLVEKITPVDRCHLKLSLDHAL